VKLRFLKRQSFREALFLLLALSIVGKALGLLREITVAHFFGAGELTDHFFVAWIIPMIFGNLIAQVIASSAVPLLHKNRVDTKRFFVLVLISLLFLSSLLYILSDEILRIMAPGFTVFERKETLLFLRGMIPAFFFLTSIGFLRGFYYSRDQYLLPSTGNLLFNGFFILFLFLLARRYPVRSLLVGVNVGALSFFLFLLFVWLRSPKESYGNWKDTVKSFGGFLLLFLSILLAVGSSYVNRAVDRAFASFLNAGDVSALHYGARLMWIPIEIFIFALGTSIFPLFSKKFSEGKKEELFEWISHGLKWAWIGVIPISIVMVVFSKPIVSLVYGRGSFDLSAIHRTSGVLSLYSIGIAAIAGNAILLKALFAMEAKSLLLKTALLSVILNFLLDFLLITPLGVRGIALSTSLVEVVTFVYLVGSVGVTGWRERRWLWNELKYFVPATLLLTIFFFLVRGYLITESPPLIFVSLVVFTMIGYGFFFALLWLVGGLSLERLRRSGNVR
jgi:putative peptidoglycan lipid II flippase